MPEISLILNTDFRLGVHFVRECYHQKKRGANMRISRISVRTVSIWRQCFVAMLVTILSAVAGEPFEMIVIPDSQWYTQAFNEGSPDLFAMQTAWIADNVAAENIVFVTQVGDCVQYGNSYPSECTTADGAFSLLEDPSTTTLPDGIPYGIAVGNHDQTPIGEARTGTDEGATTTLFNSTFGVARFSGRSYYGGHYDFGDPGTYANNNDNHYQLFSASGMDFIVIHFEYDLVDGASRAAVLAWANDLLQTHSDRRAIVVSHYITGIHPGYIAPTPDLQSFGPQGQAIYDALKGNPNLFLTLSGHVSGVGRRMDVFGGNTVHSVLQNYQLEPSGGNGWLRIFEFDPENDQINVSTYSPWLSQFWSVNGAEPWRALAENEFTLDYQMDGFTALGTVPSVPSGTNATFEWNGLAPASTYEWYVKVSDASATVTGPISSFSTACAVNADCEDGNICTDDSCNVTTDVCEYTANTEACDDGGGWAEEEGDVGAEFGGEVGECLGGDFEVEYLVERDES